MQLTFRIDGDNYITYQLKLSAADNYQPEDGPEVIAALVSESKLSQLEMDEFLGIVAQTLDHVTSAPARPVEETKDDWRHLFRSGKL